MIVFIDWAGFITLTSPFIPRPLCNAILSTAGVGVPSFIYLIKHLNFAQESRTHEAPCLPWYSCPTISPSLLGAPSQTAGLRQGPPKAHPARAAPGLGLQPAASLCLPSPSQQTHTAPCYMQFLPPPKKVLSALSHSVPAWQRLHLLDFNTTNFHRAVLLLYFWSSNRSINLRHIQAFEVSWQSFSYTAQ